ncbi:MAG: hypothetical protein ACLUHE_17475 [Christensenellales bacterium]
MKITSAGESTLRGERVE